MDLLNLLHYFHYVNKCITGNPTERKCRTTKTLSTEDKLVHVLKAIPGKCSLKCPIWYTGVFFGDKTEEVFTVQEISSLKKKTNILLLAK